MSHDANACEEFSRSAGLSRRRLLQGMVAAGGVSVATSLFGQAVRQTAFGATTGGNIVVVISLRGGIDGLGLVVPHGDPAYYTARPTIGVPKNTLLSADSMFGLHPNLQKLQWLFTAGELAAVHAVGMAVPNRSHFAAMEEIEDADPSSSARRGWVNRMIGLDADAGPLEAVHFTSSMQPTMLVGPEPTLAADRLHDVSLAGADPRWDDASWQNRRTSQLETVWGSAAGVLGVAGRSALDTVATVAPVAAQAYTPQNGVTYPTNWPATDLSAALKDTAQLIRADLGTEVVSIDYGSWDMHSDYGTVEWGDMQSMTAGFAGALDAFMRDLGTLRSKVTVVTISEFGRRVEENGSRGLDHGWGNVMLLAGGGVKGGQYYGSWPGLGDGNLVEGDLAVTTDYRNVLGEVVDKRLGRSVSTVFPGLSYSPLGVIA
jgi:uncharacterized protein (DUF1501 family)